MSWVKSILERKKEIKNNLFTAHKEDTKIQRADATKMWNIEKIVIENSNAELFFKQLQKTLQGNLHKLFNIAFEVSSPY